MTVVFGKLDDYTKFGYELGKEYDLRLIGQVIADGVQVAVVDSANTTNEIPHITLTTDKGIKPFASNKVLSEYMTLLEGGSLMVKVRAGFFTKQQNIYYGE